MAMTRLAYANVSLSIQRALWLAVVGLLLVSPSQAQAQEPSSPLPVPSPGGTEASAPASRFWIAGFADINFSALRPEGEGTSFRNGGFDLYATASISDHWSALVELCSRTTATSW